jgi:preprotein translocase subunit Sss1
VVLAVGLIVIGLIGLMIDLGFRFLANWTPKRVRPPQ